MQSIRTFGKPIAKKHYNIVFIKGKSKFWNCFNKILKQNVSAPTLQPDTSETIQNEHKTLVYVLVRKPEREPAELLEPTVTKPSKPEVFFVKYKGFHWFFFLAERNEI